MRRFLFSPLLALTALTVPATGQTAPPTATAAPTAPTSPTSTAAQYRLPMGDSGTCPVAFSVARRSATDLLEADSAARRPDTQAIEVDLRPSENRHLRSAEIVVHAYAGGPGWLPVRQAGERPSIVDRSFHVEAGSAGHIQRSLVLERINGIESVELVALRFTDGQSWRSSESEACRAVPSLYLAISAGEQTSSPR